LLQGASKNLEYKYQLNPKGEKAIDVEKDKKERYKEEKMNQLGFFDEDRRLKRLSEMGDPLEKITTYVNWELFHPILKKVFKKEDRRVGGRPAWDYMLMFKILLLQAWYNIADDKAEYMINDRLSFQRYLGLTLGSKVPDAKTIWLFRDTLSKTGVYKELFTIFGAQMESQGLITRKGSIVDATFVDVPRQRNNREENKTIKEGGIPEEWEKPENANKLKQKDTDARWTKKNNETHYGYKDHIKADADSKIIVEFEVTNAAVHDSQELEELVDKKDQEVYADSAYVGEVLHKSVQEKNPGVKLEINEKGYRNRPLTEEQKASNREKSRTRVRVEHVFGHMSNSMGGLFIRCIGIRRATCMVALKNLAYNLSRYAYLACAKMA
jgi:IS5 family transposase